MVVETEVVATRWRTLPTPNSAGFDSESIYAQATKSGSWQVAAQFSRRPAVVASRCLGSRVASLWKRLRYHPFSIQHNREKFITYPLKSVH